MIPYILHVTIIIAVCFLFYKLLLQKETFFRLNRWTLLLCLAVSFALPFLPVPQQWSWRGGDDTATPLVVSSVPLVTTRAGADATRPTTGTIHPATGTTRSATGVTHPATSGTQSAAGSIPSTAGASQPTSQPASSPLSAVSVSRILHWLYYIYLFGVALFLANILMQTAVLLFQAYTRPVVRDGRFRIVEMSGDKAPCSFGNNIFINPATYDWDTYNQILLHEKIHVRQGHSVDILIAEIVLAFQWFNPFAWFYRKEVENNLEFLTDQSLLNGHQVERSDYQLNLLKVSAPHLPLGVTTNYNQSLLKRRIIMMNSKSSSFHTIWKYFFLLPLLTCLVCALNKPLAYGQSSHISMHQRSGNPKDGAWFATTKDDKLCFELKDDKDEHSWSNSSCIAKTEFASLPSMGKCEFSLVRESGTMVFTGQFDGEQGYGHYSFKADAAYFNAIREKGIVDMNDNDQFAFFLINIKKDYIDMLQHNGFPHIAKNNLIAMAAMGIDRPYLESWKELGYTDLSENDVIAAKAMGLNKAYINELQSAGYNHLGIQQLIAFKAQGINGDYVRQIRGYASSARDAQSAYGPAASVSAATPASGVSPAAGSVTVNSPAGVSPSAPAIPSVAVSSSPAVSVSVSAQATPSPAPMPSVDNIIAFRSLNIDSGYLQALKRAGYADIPLEEITSMKSLNIDADYIENFEALGYKHIAPSTLIALKSLGITPDYIKGFQRLGYTDISLDEIPSLKSMGVTGDYINEFRRIGYTDIPLSQLPALKSLNITPEYIQGFRNIGYKDIPLEQLPALKSMGITPQYIKGFRDIGFTNIPIEQLPALKSMGITAAYITRMKEKGFISNDLNKYMQLKSSFN